MLTAISLALDDAIPAILVILNSEEDVPEVHINVLVHEMLRSRHHGARMNRKLPQSLISHAGGGFEGEVVRDDIIFNLDVNCVVEEKI